MKKGGFWLGFPTVSLLSLVLTVLVFVTLFLLVSPGNYSVEKRIYTHYAVSLIEDFDLNVINQIPKKEAWLLTSTYNYPDMHSNGVVVLWGPFLLIAKFIADLSGTSRDVIYRTAQSLINVFWGLISVPLLWILVRRVFSARITTITLTILLFCTPFFWHLIYQPENADITSLVLSASLMNLYLLRSKVGKNRFPFIIGMALFLSVAVKFNVIAFGLLFIHFLYENRVAGIRVALRSVFWFCVGSGLLAIPILLNESLKNGYFNYTYFDTLMLKFYLLPEILFAPSGYLTTYPFFALLIVTVCFLSIRHRIELEYWVYLAIPIVTVLLESFNYLHNCALGPRHWICNLPCFALVLGKVLSVLTSRGVRYLFFIGCALTALWSVVATYVYFFDYETYFYSWNWLALLRKKGLVDFAYLFKFQWIEMKLILFPIVLVLILLLLWAYRLILRTSQPKVFIRGFVFLSAFYLVITAANLTNNAKSIQKVPARLIESAVIGNGPHINSYFENAGSLQRAIKYYNLQGEPSMALGRRRELERYVSAAAKEIIVDPVDFKSTLVPGRDRYVPQELWEDE